MYWIYSRDFGCSKKLKDSSVFFFNIFCLIAGFYQFFKFLKLPQLPQYELLKQFEAPSDLQKDIVFKKLFLLDQFNSFFTFIFIFYLSNNKLTSLCFCLLIKIGFFVLVFKLIKRDLKALRTVRLVDTCIEIILIGVYIFGSSLLTFPDFILNIIYVLSNFSKIFISLYASYYIYTKNRRYRIKRMVIMPIRNELTKRRVFDFE